MASSGDNSGGNSSRRPPQSLQGVMHMAIEAGGSATSQEGTGDTVQVMHPERRQWLNNALQGMTTDWVKTMKDHLDNLSSTSVPNEVKVDSLQSVTDMAEDLDIAQDFHKIGGYSLLPGLLQNSEPGIRWRTADLIATLVQNNPYCQSAALSQDIDLMASLLRMLDSDGDNECRIKALYAVSCLCREHDEATGVFQQQDGFSVLVRAMQSGISRLQTKAAFFLSSLLIANSALKDILCNIGMAEQLIGLLQTEHNSSHEHLMGALLGLVSHHDKSIAQCKQEQLNLEQFLRQRIEEIKSKEEFQEEKDYAEQLLKICFKKTSQSNSVDR